ncbi:MAG: DUF2459 domain-containing protein [Alphaproteobacteria bacterium]|nr:MAG: DUF2459 domain-containing protein [Alphaproteobacteria bacterium]
MTRRRRFSRTGGVLTQTVLAIAVGTVAALWTWTAAGDPALNASPGEVTTQVHLLNNGFHTDLAVPRATLTERPGPLGEAARSLAPGDWILIGWGDAKFYVDQSPMEGRLLDGGRAFFAPGNRSVIMLDPDQTDPTTRFAPANRNTLTLSPRALTRMLDQVEASLDLTDGAARIAANRPGDDARFYASREHFWIGHLCNHWTAGVLNAGGIAVRPLRSVTAGEVMTASDSSGPASGL